MKQKIQGRQRKDATWGSYEDAASEGEEKDVSEPLNLALHSDLCLLRPDSLLRIHSQLLTCNGRDIR